MSVHGETPPRFVGWQKLISFLNGALTVEMNKNENSTYTYSILTSVFPGEPKTKVFTTNNTRRG